VYAQAVTPAKRNAQGKVVAMLRETKKEEKAKSCVSPLKNAVSGKSFIVSASPTRFEPVLPP